jgi:hypothetical protein
MSAAGGAGATAAASAPSDLPSDKVLFHAAKLAMEQDKPIMMDYYRETRTGTAFLGVDKETKEEILVKSPEEYTSPVKNKFKVKDDFIFITENSIYIVHGTTKKKEISTAGM